MSAGSPEVAVRPMEVLDSDSEDEIGEGEVESPEIELLRSQLAPESFPL